MAICDKAGLTSGQAMVSVMPTILFPRLICVVHPMVAFKRIVVQFDSELLSQSACDLEQGMAKTILHYSPRKVHTK